MNKKLGCISFMVIFVLGCGEPKSPPPVTVVEKPVVTDQVEVSESGTIKGRAIFDGTPPAPVPLEISADPICQAAGAGPISEDLLVSGSGGIQNVFVYVKEGLTGKNFPAPAEAVTLDQSGCRYSPHVFGLQTGQKLVILNSDATLHNVHALPRNSSEFNLGMPIRGMKLERKFDKQEMMVKFKCDVHPWMAAYAGVLPHPFFSVSDAEGSYQITGLPEGRYVLGVWHETMGEQELSADVRSGRETILDFTFKEMEKK